MSAPDRYLKRLLAMPITRPATCQECFNEENPGTPARRFGVGCRMVRRPAKVEDLYERAG
jgi:hypothetical protein